MRQVLQSIRTKELSLSDVPPPALFPGGVRVRTAASLISAGTEKMLVDLAKKSLIGKAQARPDLVRQVVNKAQKEGWLNTFQNVMSKMERPMPLGYSAAGVVEQVGADVRRFKVGDRVAIAGAGYASHAELNSVPQNLVALVPEGVSFEQAAYTTVASIALQGVRMARPELGDNVVVIGLGLIGLITVQLLKANGCRVLGVDLDPGKVETALRLGMDAGVGGAGPDVVRAVEVFARGHLTDHCIITAATSSNGPIELAGEVTRQNGQVVVVGAVGMNVPRDIYYKKELELKVSMSYGPGRYDPSYEEGGVDYPYAYVRWTEQRNMEAVLDLMASSRLNVSQLTTHRYPFGRALDAYALIEKQREPYVGILLEYDLNAQQEEVVRLRPKVVPERMEKLRIGFAGAGNYAALHLIPHLKHQEGVELAGLVTSTGLNAEQKARKFGFAYCATDFQVLLDDSEVDTVFIATRHRTHAEFAIRALEVGKHVFVEKPMVVDEVQLGALSEAYEQANAQRPTGLMVGLNRRFAPAVVKLKGAIDRPGAKQVLYRVNSGRIPTTSWLHESAEGGGMLVGEMCHFVDLMIFLTGERPAKVFAQALSLRTDAIADYDNITIVITFDGGSVGTLCYNTIGDKSAPKELIEVYAGGTVAVLNDFRSLEITTGGKRSRERYANQNKGQAEQIAQTVRSFCSSGTGPIPFDQLVAGMQAIFAARTSLLTGEPVELEPYRLRTEAEV